MHTKRIVVGYDGSDGARAALAWGVDHAEGRELDVLVVVTLMDPLVGGFREADEREGAQHRDEAVRALQDAALPDARVQVVHGPTSETLIDRTGPGDVLVVGSRGHGVATGALLGSVSQHLAHHARCPVVAARPARNPEERRIGVGLDGSSASLEALRWACDLASTTDERVVAVHGFYARRHGPGSEVSTAEALNREIAQHEQDLAAWVEQAGPLPESVQVDREVVAVPGKQALVDLSERASLVVVGSHGHRPVAEMLLGSVGQHVLHHAHCPVAVVR
ncbi:universal stress protein [Nocardioides sp. GCM10027113]|uniref:universal stress protein n=1 Tax=unclassified Nocardioides TaxID=2615069 RepID=UPI003608D99B